MQTEAFTKACLAALLILNLILLTWVVKIEGEAGRAADAVEELNRKVLSR